MVNCKVVGVEKQEGRYDASIRLLNAFKVVLGNKACFTALLNNKVLFKYEDMTTFFPRIDSYTHVFFNNYGKWFTDASKATERPIIDEFVDALAARMRAGSQVTFILNSIQPSSRH